MRDGRWASTEILAILAARQMTAMMLRKLPLLMVRLRRRRVVAVMLVRDNHGRIFVAIGRRRERRRLARV